ncbi:MAG: double-strand break repair protein AddB, partial [Alphaproteobacteria bacterium]|nr:double-strand break repair protein AddB [Alphaproteobacteria bacterium]
RRQLLLTRLILAGHGGGRPTPDQAARLSLELGRLLDQVQTERLPLDRLETLAPEDYAEHWQLTLRFLTILTEAWPEILRAEGAIDPIERRNLLTAAQCEAWLSRPPPGPVIAAGSTGSIPATADLLRVVASLPGGEVVLPGLDRDMDEENWNAVADTHPQFGLKKLLERLEVERGEVADWPAPEPSGPRAHPDRRRLAALAMRPPATCHGWRESSILSGGALSGDALDGVERVDCPTPREEALVIALMMRETLEHEGRTAALVTPDRSLARRVAAELGRWGVVIDDSAGRPLGKTPPGVFLRLTARMAAEAFAPYPLLAACQHPLAAGGMEEGRFRALTRLVDMRILRGARPAPGIAGLRAVLAAREAGDGVALDGWLQRMEEMSRPFAALMEAEAAPLAGLVRAHMEFAETLAASAELPGPARLWAGEAGEAAARFAAELFEAAPALPSIDPRSYPALLEAFMESAVVRPSHGGHPRLFIWGPLEARMQQPDLLILGALNEGTWPPEPAADPWMSRPMRRQFGLASPERRIGLSAHDFAQGFCAPRVVLTRSRKVDGAPTKPSRWLLRLDAVSRATGLDPRPSRRWLDWAVEVDRAHAFDPMPRPAPRPPVGDRPRMLSVTEIETWMRDPYAIYARHILRLKALDSIDADPGSAEYGSLVHAALDAFVKRYPAVLPDDAKALLLGIGEETFAPVLALPGVWAFWWPRFERIAGWFVETERKRRASIAATHTEVGGRLELPGRFLLTAKADRIDVLKDGSLALVDYKTGIVPRPKEVAAGFSPQLPLEAAIARAGGFKGVSAGPVSELSFWHLRGNAEGGKETSAGKDPEELARAALEGLKGLIAAFDDPSTPYEARPHPAMSPRYSDYQHLARVREWSSGEGEAEE